MANQKKTKGQLSAGIEEMHRQRRKDRELGKPHHFEEGLYSTIENTSKAGIYVVQDGKFQFVNDFTSRRGGYRKEELIGMDAMNLVHPDDREQMRKNAIAMLKGRQTSPYVFRTVSRNGEIHWITETLTPIRYKGKRAVLGTSMDITEQVTARNKLAELEALEASILEAIPHAVIGLRDRRIIFANDGVKTVFGWTAQELTGQSTRVLYPSDEAFEAIAEDLYATLDRQRTFNTEFICRHQDGRHMTCMVSASRIGESLQDKSIVIVFEDITDRKQAEELYRTMANSSQVGVYVVQNGIFQFVNRQTAKYAGYSENALVGMNAMSLVHPEDRHRIQESTREMLQGKRTLPHEFRVIRRDGQIRWIMETVTYIPFRGSLAVLGNAMDITEQIEARVKLLEHEALEASILEAIPHAVLGLKGQTIIFANDGARTVFGWPPDELIGKDVGILYRGEKDYARITKNLYLTLGRQRTFLTEFPCRAKDGSHLDCLVSASRIGESLREGHVVITYEDITDRKRASRELERSREQLRNLSAYLESAREKERTRIARELHDELGQLLTALNMDIFLLINNIPADHKFLLEKTESMVHLINMTMETLKRIYMDLRPGMLDHLGLTASIGWQAEEFQKRTGIKCKVTVDPEDIMLQPELSTAIFRIFQETLTNISRHAEATRVDVRLLAVNGTVELIVKDNGKGITQEQMAKPDSFGLLGIRERVYHWGGEVDITGKRGRGTTVKVCMPLQDKGEAR